MRKEILFPLLVLSLLLSVNAVSAWTPYDNPDFQNFFNLTNGNWLFVVSYNATGPSFLQHINQTGFLTYFGTNPYYIYGGDTAGDDINIYPNTVDTGEYIQILGGSQTNFAGNASFNSGTLFVDATAGLVGMGTTNPTAGLELTTSNPANNLVLSVAGGLYVNDSAGAKVGIGTSAPIQLLDIEGGDVSIEASGANPSLYIGDTVGTAGAYGGMQWVSSDYLNLFTTGNKNIVFSPGTGNLGIGTSDIEAWSGITAIEAIDTSIGFGTDTDIHMTGNAWWDGANWKYKTTDFATNYYQYKGAHNWRVAASGTADNTITWTNAMKIDSSGNVSIRTTTTDSLLAFPSVSTGNNQVIRFQNPAATTDSAISVYADASGSLLVLGANYYLASGGATRYNTGEESSYITLHRDGTLRFGIGGTGATASEVMALNSTGLIIKNGGFGYGSAQAGYQSISSADWAGANPDVDDFSINAKAVTAAATVTLYAPIHLPNGAQLEGVILYGSDATNSFSIVRGTIADQTTETVLCTTVHTDYCQPGALETIDSTTYYYVVNTTLGNADTIRGAYMKYYTSTVLV